MRFQCYECGRTVGSEDVRRRPLVMNSPRRVNVCPECYEEGTPSAGPDLFWLWVAFGICFAALILLPVTGWLLSLTR